MCLLSLSAVHAKQKLNYKPILKPPLIQYQIGPGMHAKTCAFLANQLSGSRSQQTSMLSMFSSPSSSPGEAGPLSRANVHTSDIDKDSDEPPDIDEKHADSHRSCAYE